MSTTIVETWSGADLSQLGPIYPMVGTEFTLFLLGLIFWLGFHVLQMRIEGKEMEADESAARSPERLQRVFAEEAE
ncbi:hypothetical protein DDZ14_03835 [Maritimibacter sp. 55A14]|uniref:hypothetical protein n=1 Tax=Maritimibacter sp. 55A14 TaxID=2174844 RepID=UPI000D607881|nr:hypothetical protein [Maritimibacter sp. 55A14]PWE33803.1 hypothetical protein DDZ14_03835 [Maritimibacter sp. 55A14]